MKSSKSLLLAGIAGLAIPFFATAAEPKLPNFQSGPAGRYVPIPPPSAGNGTFANFLWVLDTATGVPYAYRMAKVTDNKGEIEQWIIERLSSEKEYMRGATGSK